MKYRKITEAEFKELLARFGASLNQISKDTGKLSHIRDYLVKYYPPGATSVIVSFDSEYNDCTYDVRLQYVAVYDRNQNEIYPLKGKEKEARAKWNAIFEYYGPELSEPLEDQVFLLDLVVPELYVCDK